MEEYADIYYVDENRNATTRDHRTQSPSSVPWRPAPSTPTRTVYVAPPVQRPMAQPAQVMYPTAPIYGQPQIMYPPGYPVPGTLTTILGKLTTGQIVEMVAQVFAALQSLPGAPVATRDTSTDIGNLMLYQSALAQHAKRDEQYRTLGGLVAKLVG